MACDMVYLVNVPQARKGRILLFLGGVFYISEIPVAVEKLSIYFPAYFVSSSINCRERRPEVSNCMWIYPFLLSFGFY